MFDIMKNSRLYKFLRKIAGDDVSITPANTLEDCLDDIAESVSGGGLPEVTAADNGMALIVADGVWGVGVPFQEVEVIDKTHSELQNLSLDDVNAIAAKLEAGLYVIIHDTTNYRYYHPNGVNSSTLWYGLLDAPGKSAYYLSYSRTNYNTRTIIDIAMAAISDMRGVATSIADSVKAVLVSLQSGSSGFVSGNITYSPGTVNYDARRIFGTLAADAVTGLHSYKFMLYKNGGWDEMLFIDNTDGSIARLVCTNTTYVGYYVKSSQS